MPRPKRSPCRVVEGPGHSRLATFNLMCKGVLGRTNTYVPGSGLWGLTGYIEIAPRRLFLPGLSKPKSVWIVENIGVEPEYRRKGYATALYAAAAKFACKKRSRLASTRRTSGAYSNDFWAKQARKGRATFYPRPTYLWDAFILNECGPDIDLSGLGF